MHGLILTDDWWALC